MLPSRCCVVALLALLALWSPSVSAQSYIPLIYPQSSCSSPTATLVTLGDQSVVDVYGYAAYPQSFYGDQVRFTPFNNTLFGAVLSQLALPLADNSAASFGQVSGPVHLRLGVYLVGQWSSMNNNAPLSLVGQTAEITLFPSGPQTLYANLLQPVQLLSGSQYALAVWSDNIFNAYESESVLYGFNEYVDYSDYSLPGFILAYGPQQGNTVAIAATGCLDSASITAPGTALYYMCAYTDQYAPATSSLDSTIVSTTTFSTVSGVVTVSTSQSTTSFGSGYSVLSFTGTLSTQLSGQDSYYYPSTTISSVSLVRTNATNKLTAITPSNLLYTTGAAAVDTNGLSFTGSSGVQYVLQWNSGTSQYQLLTSANGGAAPASPIVASTLTLVRITAASDPQFTCSPTQRYTPPAVPSCPSGYTTLYAGDLQRGQLNSYMVQPYSSSAYGNTLYFRSFVVQVSGTLITSLSTYLLAYPGVVVHARLGLYALNGTLAAPSWTLLAMASEQVIANPAGGVVEVPLSPAVSVQAGTYAIGFWFDQPVYTYTGYWGNPYPFSLLRSYTSLSSDGAMPSFATPQQGYQWVPAAAQTCVPGTQLVQFSFCAAATSGSYYDVVNDLMSGVLTALATPLTNSFGSYYVVLSANASRTQQYVWENVTQAGIGLGYATNPVAQRLYIPSTTAAKVALDSTGLQFIYSQNYFYSSSLLLYAVSAQPIPYTPAYQYGAAQPQSYGLPTPINVGPAEFTYQPYTAGSPIPDCGYTPITALNTLTPPSQPILNCTFTSLVLTLGDVLLADYANQAEGHSLPPLTVYTNPFSVAISGLVISQVVVDILANTAQNVSVYMGVYSSTGALLATSPLLFWQQVYDQQVVANLTSPLSLAAGSYYAAIVTDVPLNIAASTTLSPSFAVSSLTVGLPATISLTAGSAGAVPLFVTGCAPATHSMCAQVQYYTPATLGGPASTTYQYQGLLAAAVNADGSVSVRAANIHAAALQHLSTSYTSSTAAYTVLGLAAPSTAYPSSAAGLDSTGLQLVSSSLGLSVQVSYSAAAGQYVDTWGASAYPGSTVVASSFSLTPVTSTGTVVPTCSVLSLSSSITSSPAPPTCAAGSAAVTVGDYVSADYGYNAEQGSDYVNYFDYFVTVPIITGNTAVQLSQLALGLLNNPNTVAKLRFGLYNSSQQLLGATNEVTSTNSQDAVVVGVLATPLVLAANTQYYLAVWTDSNLYMAYNSNYNNWCGEVAYVSSQPLPAFFSFTSFEPYCATIPLAGLGCTVVASSSSSTAPPTIAPSSTAAVTVTPPILTPTSSPSTASPPVVASSPSSVAPSRSLSSSPVPGVSSSSSSSAYITAPISSITSNSGGSSDVSLSAGAVAGIVIGCVFGSNLLLLICIFLMCGGAGRKQAGSSTPQKSNSEQDPNSRIELATQEPSKFEKETE